ncbi:hypothetical protein [Ornithinibacillus californiensis]|uniref:hypothetical protein n=1 Tax=Ornithinibacillus californiensis TaxID=161536 RepID=UPI00064DB325|nr:hypothetical protein [Ornithinibacillus californiensis]
MKNQLIDKKYLYISLIFILVLSSVFAPIGVIFANNSAQDTSGNSGGFIIETEKVDGAMDLIGALTGKISISEGNIYGLTITKVIERGEGLEPLVVRITSPGPIPVSNLEAQTVNNELPNIGGLCKPGQLGWVCLENVVMNVEAQFVESISLANANIHTCYLSDCGELPDYNPMLSLEELEKILNGEDDKEREELLQDILDLLDGQEEDLAQLKELLAIVSESLNEILGGDYVGETKRLLSKLESSISKNIGLDKLLPISEDIPATLEYVSGQLIQLTEVLTEGGKLIEELESNTPTLESMLAEYEKRLTDLEKVKSQLGVYEQLIQFAELQKAGKPIEYSLSDDTEEESDETESLKERLSKLNEQLEGQRGLYEDLKEELEKLRAERQQIEEDWFGIKSLLEKLLRENGSEDEVLDKVLDPVKDNVLDPVNDKVLDPVKEKVLDPIDEKVLTPVLDPVKENVLDPVQEDVVNPVLEEVEEKVVEPIKEEVLEPILDPITGKLIDPVTGEVIDLVLDPVTGMLLDPITEEAIIPVLNPLTGKLINPKTGEIVNRILNPVTGELLDPLTNGLLKKILDGIL